VTVLLLCRHGRTDWNDLGRYQGQTDVPLNKLGRQQAQALAQLLRSEPIGAVYSSDLSRAADTASEIARFHGLEVRRDARLREINQGRWEGLTVRQIRERDAALEALEREKSERAKTEDMLRQAQKMEAIGQLTGGVAHDFNNLLTVVVGSLVKLERRLAPEEDLRASVQRAMAGAERAAALTQQLLAFARKQPLQATVLDPNRLVERVAELLRRTLDECIAVKTALAPDLRPARVDANQLESALLNLAVNARDAMPEGGTLTLRTRNLPAAEVPEVSAELASGSYVVIEVADTGLGMPGEVLDHAFEPFFTTKPLGRGSGLGLSQVYGFAKQSNGHVALDSAPGRGTTVRLYLPCASVAVVVEEVVDQPGPFTLAPCYTGAAE
jgi:signal transduction histidine kinase